MYSVVLIEDHHQAGTLLVDFLRDELVRLVTVPDPGDSPRSSMTGAAYEDACDEPGQGQLVQLEGVIKLVEGLEGPVKRSGGYPTVTLFPLDKLVELQLIAKDYAPDFTTGIDDSHESQKLRDAVDAVAKPDILILDLAMDEDEVNRLKNAGALDTFDRAVKRRSRKVKVLRDPRSALRGTTGFKLLRAYARRLPVIVTAYSPNPLIAQHCLVNGAFAYVQKPVPSVAPNRGRLDFRHAQDVARTVMDLRAKKNTDILDVMISHYLTDVACEVLKAIAYRAISEMRL